MKPKALTVLEALFQGHDVPMDDCMVILGENDKGHKQLAIRAESSLHGPVLLTHDISFRHFLSSCEAIPDDEIIALNAAISLTKMRRGEG